MAKAPTAADRRRWSAITLKGCIVGILFGVHGCRGRNTVHHCGTGAGGRKKHWFTICLCVGHHQGADGIDGKKNFTKRTWQEHYDTETILFEKTEQLLKEGNTHD